MKQFRIVLVALLAVSALGAVLAVSASAETTLLAEWLENGNSIPAGVSRETETPGLFLLEDKGAPGEASELCSAIADGIVEVNGLDEVLQILNLAKEKIEALGGLALLGTGNKLPDCEKEKTCEEGTATKPMEVWPVGLPWHSTLFLMEDGKILDLVENAAYELLCWVLLINVEDECKAPDSEFEVVNDADNGDAAIPAGAVGEPLESCTLGGAGTGVPQADELAEIKLTNGELLTVSSE